MTTSQSIRFLTRYDLEDIYNQIRVHYNFYVSKSVFVETYMKEFKGIPTEMLEQAVNWYCSNPNNNQAPTISDIRSFFLRRKWVLQMRYREGRLDRTLMPEPARRMQNGVRSITKALNGYGSEIEEQYDHLEQERQNYIAAHPVIKTGFGDIPSEKVANDFVKFGELYDL